MAVIEQQTKRCAHCGQEKPITQFYKDSHTRDGLQSWCKQCSNERSNKSRVKSQEEALLKRAQEQFNEAVEQHLGQYVQVEQRENKAANTAIDWEQRTFDTAARIFANICAVANPGENTSKLCIEYASQFVSDYRESITFGADEESEV